MSAIVPRPYQIEAVDSLYRFFAANHDPSRNPLIAAPTGSGKSVIITTFLHSIFERWPNQKVLLLTHVKELIGQNAKHLRRAWPSAPLGIYSAGMKQKTAHMPITFASIQSAVRNPHLFGYVDLIIIDECHLVSPDENTSYQTLIAFLRQVNPYLRIIGLSATIYRLGLGMLTEGGIFTDVAYDICSRSAFVHLLDEYYLCPLIPMQTQTQLDVSGVHMRGGEFVEKELQEKVARYDLTRAAIQEAMIAAQKRQHWLIFATGIDHVHMIHDILQEFGVESTYVHSKLTPDERTKNLARFLAGDVPVMINANILTTGFDFPALDCIIMLRPTASPVLHVQTLGRGTRYDFPIGEPIETLEQRKALVESAPKQNCLVLDFAGNTRRLGPINDPKIPGKKGDEKGGDAPIKVCPACGCLNHISVRACANCGAEFEFREKISPVASTLELIVRDEPVVHWFNVNHVVYRPHIKIGSPPSLKVTYHCGLRTFNEWVCLFHDGRPIQRKAQAWWTKRTNAPIPHTMAEAQLYASTLRIPKRVRVWVNAKWPQLLNYEFEEDAHERSNTAPAVA